MEFHALFYLIQVIFASVKFTDGLFREFKWVQTAINQNEMAPALYQIYKESHLQCAMTCHQNPTCKYMRWTWDTFVCMGFEQRDNFVGGFDDDILRYCPLTYEYVSEIDKCLMVVDAFESFNQSSELCDVLDGKLLTAEDQYDLVLLMSYMNVHYNYLNIFWIGATLISDFPLVVVWQDGSPLVADILSLLNGPQSGNCLVTNTDTLTLKWVACESLHSFVCESL